MFTEVKTVLFYRRPAFLLLLFILQILLGYSLYIHKSSLTAAPLPIIKPSSIEHFPATFENISELKPAANFKKVYKIFYWTNSFWGENWVGLGSAPFEECTYSNCISVAQKEHYNSSDAVMFHMRFIKPFPKYRFPHQKWIMKIKESPFNEPNYTRFNNLFNATWTYHRKSDVWTNYSRNLFVEKTAAEKENYENSANYAKGKDKLVTWFVSDCNSRSLREKYVKHLKQYIEVDIVGACGPLKCPRSKHAECLKRLHQYKFYLSFENSVCEEYMTNKVWWPILNNAVPIVLGGYNYSSFLPHMSYIDIKDYASPQALAEYLKKLDKDDQLYNKHFEWKKHYKVVEQLQPDQCRLCEYLNKASNVTKVYDRLDLFWNKNRDCKPSPEYYSKMDKSVWT